MKTVPIFLIAVILSLSTTAQNKNNAAILVFSATKGFRHTSIHEGKMALLKLGKSMGIHVDTSEDANVFKLGNLNRYKAIVFLSTTGNILNETQQGVFQNFIRNGGGFVGIHAATDTEYDWPWYNKLVGAQFDSHPEQQEAELNVTDSLFIATKGLPAQWRHFDEWYNFKNYYWDSMKIVMTVDENTYKGGKNGNFHPVSWYHNYDGGRSFYTALGHTEESFSNPLFLAHLQGGLIYAMNYKKGKQKINKMVNVK